MITGCTKIKKDVLASEMTGVILVVLLLNVLSCSTYEAREAPPMRSEGILTAKQGPVVVYADPYFQVDRQAAVFQANFDRAGVLAIQLLIQNNGTTPLLIQRSEISLELPDGTEVRSATKSKIVDLVTQFESGLSPVGIPFTLPVYVPAEVSRNVARSDRLADYRSKEMKEATLGPGESVGGFVFFLKPSEVVGLNNAILKVRIIDVERTTWLTLRIKLLETAAPSQ